MTNKLAKPAPASEAVAPANGYRECADPALLHCFVAARDGNAFAELVRRHGPLVLGVCERTLRHAHDAEDAFQATFWVLARKAHTIRKRQSLASWLYGVAYRVAQKARAAVVARQAREKAAARPEGMTMNADSTDLREVLDDELQKLPDKYRLPVVLCYLQGKTQNEACAALGWAAGVLRGRLDRGRDLLRQRLAGRGVAVGSAGLLAAFGAAANVAVDPALLAATVQGALSAATVPLSALGSGPVPVLVKALGGTSALRFTATAVVAVFGAGVAAFGLGLGPAVVDWCIRSGPSRGYAVSTANLGAELSPDLAGLGVTVEELMRSASRESDPFRDRGHYRLVLRLWTSDRGLGRDDLAYTLYDADGRLIDRGPVRLSTSLTPGGSADWALEDTRLFEARRLVLHRAK
jgi:RNA polymerase sigma factor (sigma-70 family)